MIGVVGATVDIYWKGRDMEESTTLPSPGFYNDCKAWANWLANMQARRHVMQRMRETGLGPILTHFTSGMAEHEVDWVTPADLAKAARALREMVLNDHPDSRVPLKVYGRGANGVDPVEEEFAQDLKDVEVMALWAEEQGASSVTFVIDW